MGVRIEALLEHFAYTLSLPERAIRSVVAMAAGATKIVTDTILPRPLRDSRTYAALVGNAQRFLIERIGAVEGAYAIDSKSLPDDYVPRKVAGNILEAAGIFSVHLSPLWVFAIASDVAQGSREYLQRLAHELRRDGVIGDDVQVNELDDVLDALGKATTDSAKVFDTPPLSAADIRQLREQLVSGYGRVFKEMSDLMPRIDTLWSRMQAVANTDVTLGKLAGLMSVDLGRAAGRAVDGALTVGRATTELVGETILSSYAESLAEVERRGLLTCIDEATQPYFKAFRKQYSRAHYTWTQRFVRWFGRLFLPRRDAPAP